MDERQALDPHQLCEPVDHTHCAFRARDVVPRAPQVRGVETEGETIVPTAHGPQNGCQLLQGGTDGVTTAGRILQHQRHPGRRLSQDGVHIRTDARDPCRVPDPPMRSDVGVHEARPECRRALKLVDQPRA